MGPRCPDETQFAKLKIVSPTAMANLAIDSTRLEVLVINREIFIPNREIFSIFIKNRESSRQIGSSVNASDIAKTAIVMPFGLFEYKRMPFGLKNAAQTFQSLMDVLRDCSFAYVYLENILVASSSVDDHRQHLRQLFRKLADYGLVVNPQKCVLGLSSLEFLGHYVISSGVQPLQSRVESITDFPRQRSSKSLQEYLGMLNFYRRFVPHAASMLLPLYELAGLDIASTRSQMRLKF